MAGFKVWDASGNVVVDEGVRAGRIVAQYNVTGTSGSFSAPGLAEGDPWSGYRTNLIGGQPVVTFSGTTVSWTWEGDFIAGTLIVGVY